MCLKSRASHFKWSR